ncbi:isochorismatase [bacterium (Candidatus Blackallbacteria) CG17_big_fil_post_rev_8_21_14_2_50_48_46]|uniref:protein-tyrosine-phosphatase n=1 Tax=bacterium (Candidatus Blackallbacteria) CG17_big_fil_post_rev_8_21_14_2_50_48_46 TaxID=2014261 RepID=A0A2M7G3D4_9BACT|nr:MAG: isochorismatase [bacterium (Candidatus Blackallbacteria) CG18_big_fil_WC_8_21_14_2_50_49_26]PIW16350.1 MAG: isochorismatase [bacterium (Candidatus Blackallbacteria) CG17_big_fil_post_rev_8_21_14_2_50_48_46]PIW45364.1 MAG: isochorismatase [bacterium (Candidatus Blackallbacteria) CG13_big_fil_rev_8_21_14_2_50_49_14]
MPQALLMTQCLQNDFVKPLNPFDPLPNLLHIGYEEARRLMGDKPETGPVSRVIDWAYAQSDEKLKVMHIRDWHDPLDFRQFNHLIQFGHHCEQESEGAAFAFAEPSTDKKIEIIDTLTLNDFLDTTLEACLAPYQGQKMRVGLMGVWTEAKITFLSYELSTRYPEFELGVCSALTASSSRAQHFIALEQLEKLLGVKVFASVAEFIRFLGGDTTSMPLTGWQDARHPVIVLDSLPGLEETDSKLLRYLFRDSRVAKLHRLDGGFSGNEVLGTSSTDLHGHKQVPHVVKIGWNHMIGRERMAFEQIESVLGNNAPRLVDFVELGDRGAIKYRYASMGGGFSTTFQRCYQKGLEPEKLKRILDTVFIEQLGRLYTAAVYEKCDLLEYYQFSAQWAPNIRNRVENLLGISSQGEELEILPGLTTPNLVHFYEHELEKLKPYHQGDSSYLSFVHGDLNGANIIIDAQENVWLIDFFHTHRGHILRDLLKLENDLLYIFTAIENEEALQEACKISDLLCRIQDLRAPLPALEETGLTDPGLQNAWKMIQILRSYYPELIHADRDPLQAFIGQLRYAVHTLSFKESSPLQKKWALYTAGLCCDRIRTHLGRGRNLWVDWLPAEYTDKGKLGLTLLPGRRDLHRSLERDLSSLKNQEKATHMVCLSTSDELQSYGVPSLLENYRAQGIEVYHLPILDQKVSNQSEMKELLAWIETALANKGHVVLHCVGGLGRSGLAAACFLKQKGLSSEAALHQVRLTRSPRAIETLEQENFLREF